MPINFDQMPTDKRGNLDNFEAGLYNVLVEAADMKASKTGKAPYLNVRLGVFSDNGSRIGACFDIFTESTASLALFKLRRFLESIGLNLQGDFELKDLPKIIVNKRLKAYLKVEKNEQYGDKLIVDIGPDDIYLPVDDNADELDIGNPTDEDAPFEPDTVTGPDSEPDY